MLKVPLWATCAFLLMLITPSIWAQQTPAYTSPHRHLNEGIELFERANYVAAQQHFELASKYFDAAQIQLKGEAEYYRALCAVELFNNDAEHLMRSFINNYPDNQKVNSAYFEMGKLRYREKKDKDAIFWFNQANKNALSVEKKDELLFKLGYSYFSSNDNENAKRCFFETKDTDNRYAPPATYYYAHIAYSEKNYATALKGFQVLENDETFAPLAPYYISQILFLQKEFSKVVEYAPPVLENASPKRAPEIARIIGESYYRLRQFDKAIPYIEQYIASGATLTREDNYLIGFVFYRNDRIADAAKYLELVPTDDDEISQNAYYHLADCYIKMDDKMKARQAFSMASRSNYDMGIKEDALFQFAKITYELFYNPFNEAIAAFNEYISLFPDSPRTDEAYLYLTQAYMSTKNYQAALASLDNIKNPDSSIRQAYQRVAFFRGIELFQNMSLNEAIQKFTLSLKYSEFNRTLSALSLYWRGEGNFRLENYEKALDDYNNFVLSPGAFSLPEFQMAHYNMGYTYFQLKEYDEAIVWFRKYVTNHPTDTTQFLSDAYNRIGDSYFVQRKYWPSLDFYEQAYLAHTIDDDYALFQRGFTYGLVERPEKKIEHLTQLIAEFPQSNYLDDALFELAETYLTLGDDAEAIESYSRIEKEFPGSAYYVKSLVQLGLAAYNQNRNQDAMQFYKRVVEGYPNTPEAKNALLGLRNIYVDMGDVNAFYEYTNRLGSLGTVSTSERDSISFISSEKLYMTGDTQKAIQALAQYLTDFPQGSFSLPANFYLGDCYFKTEEYDNALEALEQVLQQPKNQFTVQALQTSSKIYARQERYDKTYEAYDKMEELADAKPTLLDARMGKLRSAYLMGNYQAVVESAAKVLITDKLPQELETEARFKKAKSLVELNRLDDALADYSKISQRIKTVEGSQAKYEMIRILYLKGELDKAEAEVFKFAEANTPHQFWLAKSFILLSDIYFDKNDYFQARATLQSVIDGYESVVDGILEEAEAKRIELIKAQREKQTPKPDTIRINYTF